MSIYGESFPDENLRCKMEKRGLLAMANSGRDSNNSQFFVTFEATTWLEGLHVVMGEMVEGEEVLEMLNIGGSVNGTPTSVFTIDDCGVF